MESSSSPQARGVSALGSLVVRKREELRRDGFTIVQEDEAVEILGAHNCMSTQQWQDMLEHLMALSREAGCGDLLADPGAWNPMVTSQGFAPHMLDPQLRQFQDHHCFDMLLDILGFEGQVQEWYVKPDRWLCMGRNFVNKKGVVETLRGSLPHMDTNPWTYNDYERRLTPEEIDHPKTAEGMRNRLIMYHRPFQILCSLTDCPGGAEYGGFGACPGSHYHIEAISQLPAFGLNGRWGHLCRFYRKPTSKFLREAEEQEPGITQRVHKFIDDILDTMVYPPIPARSILLWNRDMLHSGPRGNVGSTQVRVYVGRLPRGIPRNEQYVWEVQRAELLKGRKVTGVAQERGSEVHVLESMLKALTECQLQRLGLSEKMPPWVSCKVEPRQVGVSSSPGGSIPSAGAAERSTTMDRKRAASTAVVGEGSSVHSEEPDHKRGIIMKTEK